ncbi:MAG: response regulator [Gammaproteobacteria bacterium]|nr:response regulator [Gammaproteobacteria bacterium]
MSNRYKILIVDDEPGNLKVLSKLLQPYYQVIASNSGQRVFEILDQQDLPDMILLDVMMPEMDGFQVCKKLKQNPKTQHIPIMFITAKTDAGSEEKGLMMGGVDYITKPIIPMVVLARIKTHLTLYDVNRSLENKVNERTEQLDNSRLQVIQRLGRAAEYKDNDTGLHVIRMSYYSRLLAQELGIESSWVNLLFNAAPMHDLGKIGIPDNILSKPGKLDKDEWEIMMSHARKGAEIIGDPEDSDLLDMAARVALTHHEKWDGSGYPKGLSKDQIPLEGRIVAIADVFDALTSVRPYKDAWSVHEAMDLLKAESGTHFDPDLVPIFLGLEAKILNVMKEFSEDQSA